MADESEPKPDPPEPEIRQPLGTRTLYDKLPPDTPPSLSRKLSGKKLADILQLRQR